MNILITGSNGQLGNEIKNISKETKPLNFLFTDIETLDICNKNDVPNFISNNNIDIIVNCAAYTDVDGAENDKINADKINTLGPLILAEASLKKNIPLIHISTDYVYDSSIQNTPFKEIDNTNPQSIYAVTKLQGEKNIKVNPKHIIIRTSWLYSVYGKNFAKYIIKLADERPKLNIVFDQAGSPTHAADLAKVILKIIQLYYKKPSDFISGIYNYSNEGVCSWYDFALEIINITEKNCSVFPIETSEYPTPAKRPAYSVLNKNKIKKTFSIEIPHWKESLKRFIRSLN